MSQMQEKPVVVEMHRITKHFPGVLASDHVDFTLRKGEIHTLLGENGAGKSTLMNILAGLYRPDSGVIKINQKQVSFHSPRDAINAGIGMVHQHFMLVNSQTVTENVLLGLDEPRFFLRLAQYEKEITRLSAHFGLKVDAKAKVWQLSVGEQQRVEILKMLYRGVEVLIMDEPTAVLAPQEIHALFDTLRTMVAEGKSIIFISHKLNEVMEISDSITVLSRGKVTAAAIDTKQINRQELAKLMVGREVIFQMEKQPLKAGEIVLSVEDVYARNDKGLSALQGISLNVRAGEIVGLAGVAGNGQNELSDIIGGLRESERGNVILSGVCINNSPVSCGLHQGLAYIPADRTHVGTSPNLSITDNVIMKNYHTPPISHGWVLDKNQATRFANELKQAYDIVAPNVGIPARLLSGGNLQRVILAREISGNPTFLLAVQPTRGLDVGAIEGVQRLLLAQRDAGAAIMLISEELEELLALSDRIYVIFEGNIMGELKASAEEPIDVNTIGLLMTGSNISDIQKMGETQHD